MSWVEFAVAVFGMLVVIEATITRARLRRIENDVVAAERRLAELAQPPGIVQLRRNGLP